MKIFYFLLILLSLSTIDADAQKRQVSEDPFTNEKVISYNWKGGIVFYESKTDEIKFGIRCTYSGEQNVTIEKGNKAFFKLDNGEVMELLTCVDAHPDTHINASQYGANVYTFYTFVFSLSKDQLDKLAKFKTTAVRYPDTNGEYLDVILKGKRNKYTKAVLEGGQYLVSNMTN